MRKSAGGEAGLEVDVVRRIVWVQQDVSGDDTADTAHIGIHVSQRQGFCRRRGGPSSVGMGVGRGLEFDSDLNPKARDRCSATAIQSIGLY